MLTRPLCACVRVWGFAKRRCLAVPSVLCYDSIAHAVPVAGVTPKVIVTTLALVRAYHAHRLPTDEAPPPPYMRPSVQPCGNDGALCSMGASNTCLFKRIVVCMYDVGTVGDLHACLRTRGVARLLASAPTTCWPRRWRCRGPPQSGTTWWPASCRSDRRRLIIHAFMILERGVNNI